jgi:5-methylcytosine-specific restriction endonuclease McrA
MVLPVNIPKNELYRLFILENKTRKYCADYFKCSEFTIQRRVKKYGIQKPKELENKNKERRETLVCEWCQSEFVVMRFRAINEKLRHKYCSQKCRIEAQRELTSVSEDHKKARYRRLTALRRVRQKAAYDETANQEVIKKIYLEASRLTQETGIRHEVDHIIPISRGGKHHEDNLRVVTITENRRKGPKLLEELNQNNTKNVETDRKYDQG